MFSIELIITTLIQTSILDVIVDIDKQLDIY